MTAKNSSTATEVSVSVSGAFLDLGSGLSEVGRGGIAGRGESGESSDVELRGKVVERISALVRDVGLPGVP